MNDEEIIGLFFERSEFAIAELDKKYGRLLHSISNNILHSKEDAEECVNDAYNGVWNRIPPEHPNPLSAYVCKIVRNISLKRYEKHSAQKRGGNYTAALDELEECLFSGTLEDEIENSELTKCIEAFLDGLKYEDRVIFLRRYWFSDSYQAISSRSGLSEKNVSVRLNRIRKKLHNFLTERGFIK